MCGIAGIFHFDIDKIINPMLLHIMERSIAHRGPDDSGI